MDDFGDAEADTVLGDPRPWRLGALVAGVCAAALAAAIVLINQRGTAPHRTVDLGLPTGTSSAVTAGPASLAAAPSTPAPSTTYKVYHAPRNGSSTSSSRSAGRTRGAGLPGQSRSLTPTVLPPTRPPVSPTSNPPTPSVSLAEGGVANVNTSTCPHRPHSQCRQLVVTIQNISGLQWVFCYSSALPAGTPFDRYLTANAVSTKCAYNDAGTSVWVVIEGTSGVPYESNHVIWQ
jgi:hypothetical protein